MRTFSTKRSLPRRKGGSTLPKRASLRSLAKSAVAYICARSLNPASRAFDNDAKAASASPRLA